MELTLKKRLGAFATAGALALAMAPAAAMGAPGDLTADTTISVSGLDQGDSAKYYQIIKQDLTTTNPAHTGTQDWVLTDAVDKYNAAGEEKPDGIVDGTEYMDFEHKNAQGQSVNGLYVDELVIKDSTQADRKIITKKMMDAIASAVSMNNPSSTSMGEAGADGTVTANIASDKLGLYMVVAEPGENNVDTIYKPIFVSADFDQTAGKNTNTIALVENPKPAGAADDPTDYDKDPKVFKSSKLTVDKKSGKRDANGNLTDPKDSQHDVAVGDVVDFTITTNVPTYSTDYTSAVFKLTDDLTNGLELSKEDGTILTADDTSEIKVKLVNGTSEISMTPWASDSAAADYKVSIIDSKQFVVELRNDKNWGEDSNDYWNVEGQTADNQKNDRDGILYTQTGNPQLVITYKAKVTSEALEQVNQMDNTVTLNFSNKTTDTMGVGELKDKTRHYTFDIDANVFGQGESENGDKTSEIRKIAIDANGQVIEEATTTELGTKKTSNPFEWLVNAEFELKQIKKYTNSDPATTGEFVDVAAADQAVKFKDGVRSKDSSATNPKSDENGYITMKGLDAGIYELKEISAPLGYSFDPNKVYTITITPTYVLDADDNEILSSYEVKINFTDVKGAAQESKTTYTAGTSAPGKPISFLNEDGTPNTSGEAKASVTVDPASKTALIVNKKLGLLPATGGSGILFYVFIGAAIMALAIVLSRRGRKANGTVSGATA